MQVPLTQGSKFYNPRHLAFSYCDDEEIQVGLWYCKQKHLWWTGGRVYDERSAKHNGITGLGAQLRTRVAAIK